MNLQEIMDYMRSIKWEINTMLLMRRDYVWEFRSFHGWVPIPIRSTIFRLNTNISCVNIYFHNIENLKLKKSKIVRKWLIPKTPLEEIVKYI